jgi:hypothetical protein
MNANETSDKMTATTITALKVSKHASPRDSKVEAAL